MRILHTSDWHLGRSFHRVNLLAAQREFIDHLVTTVRERQVDAVLVAGDIYDRAVPPLAAVELFDDVLHRLAELGVPTVMISGNHDSARRLGVGAGLIERAGIHLRTDPTGCATPVVLGDDHGEVAFYGLPYLEPRLVREALDAPAAGHTAVLEAAMRRVRADLAARPPGTRSVVLAHAFVTGGAVSDSERDITVGGVASVPAEVFDGVDYVALGHLHGCQAITERIRYSGSPLAYSFSETAHRKSMWLVELGAAGAGNPAAPGGAALSAERVDCPVPRPLARIRGRIEDLLADPGLARHEHAWVEATLTDAVRPQEPMARLTRRFPHVLALAFDPERSPEDPLASYARRLRGRGDQQIAEDFVAHVRGGRGPDAAERTVLGDALEAVRTEESGAGRGTGRGGAEVAR
ncbi:exonuclease SbcCD subunit D [Streptomyces coffeae]|uniref:Nuclease SbcCD subunit D n=1 Tax=Streptomyces coffeae TaxID=621382 RepID=A0ABS1NKN6_9ACTN|nr:exonuclease SbcCD subunit D [Streptomyces coffeae]MBL1100638.1 exonuclease SbcCD subunit D [Streptomyces coffeae]